MLSWNRTDKAQCFAKSCLGGNLESVRPLIAGARIVDDVVFLAASSGIAQRAHIDNVVARQAPSAPFPNVACRVSDCRAAASSVGRRQDLQTTRVGIGPRAHQHDWLLESRSRRKLPLQTRPALPALKLDRKRLLASWARISELGDIDDISLSVTSSSGSASMRASRPSLCTARKASPFWPPSGRHGPGETRLSFRPPQGACQVLGGHGCEARDGSA